MKMVWPRKDLSSYREAPTDYFYADLTGNWDWDGDGYYGEWGDYTHGGGVDFANEVYVGRIPVYGGDYATLDGILQKTIDYETDPNPRGWRKNALLPMSFSKSTYDGAPLAEPRALGPGKEKTVDEGDSAGLEATDQPKASSEPAPEKAGEDWESAESSEEVGEAEAAEDPQ